MLKEHLNLCHTNILVEEKLISQTKPEDFYLGQVLSQTKPEAFICHLYSICGFL